jgi:hypothetical protein
MAAAGTPPGFERAGSGEPGRSVSLLADGPAMIVEGNSPGVASGTPVATTTFGAGTGIPAFTYPFPFNNSYVVIAGLNTNFPYSTGGQLFYSQNGGDFSCSGTSVSSGQGNVNLILTAAHCLHDGSGTPEGASTNILFIPGRFLTQQPFETWSGFSIHIPASWYSGGNLREDFGFIVADPTSNTRGDLGAAVGTQGLAWNQPVFQEFWVYGYPQQSPWVGNRTAMCTGPTAVVDSAAPGTGPDPIGMGCNFTGGSSGAGWIVGAKTANRAYVNSVVSYKLTGNPNQPLAMYGPYLQTSFYSLWQVARVDDPTP